MLALGVVFNASNYLYFTSQVYQREIPFPLFKILLEGPPSVRLPWIYVYQQFSFKKCVSLCTILNQL